MPNRSAKAWARSSEREPTATTCWRVCRDSASTNDPAIRPGASTPQRSGGASIGFGVRASGKDAGNSVTHGMLPCTCDRRVFSSGPACDRRAAADTPSQLRNFDATRRPRHVGVARITDHQMYVHLAEGSPGRRSSGGGGKREPGANPGLPRSGEWERQPSHRACQVRCVSTGGSSSNAPGKRRPVGPRDHPIPLPTSPKTCLRDAFRTWNASVARPRGRVGAKRATPAVAAASPPWSSVSGS